MAAKDPRVVSRALLVRSSKLAKPGQASKNMKMSLGCAAASFQPEIRVVGEYQLHSLEAFGLGHGVHER